MRPRVTTVRYSANATPHDRTLECHIRILGLKTIEFVCLPFASPPALTPRVTCKAPKPEVHGDSEVFGNGLYPNASSDAFGGRIHDVASESSSNMPPFQQLSFEGGAVRSDVCIRP
jgi:hypothetical protein